MQEAIARRAVLYLMVNRGRFRLLASLEHGHLVGRASIAHYCRRKESLIEARSGQTKCWEAAFASVVAEINAWPSK